MVPVQSGEDWIAKLDDDLSQPAEILGDSFRISALQREDPVCITLHAWIVADEFPPWAEVKSMLPELRSLWHHRNNLSVDPNRNIMAQEKLTERHFTIIGSKGWQGTTISILSCVFVRRSPGTDMDASTIGGPLLLVGNVG